MEDNMVGIIITIIGKKVERVAMEVAVVINEEVERRVRELIKKFPDMKNPCAVKWCGDDFNCHQFFAWGSGRFVW